MKSGLKNWGLWLGLGLMLIVVSCKKGFLDQENPTQIKADRVWKDPALAEAFVSEIYNGLGNGGFSEQMLASVSDEAVFTHTGRNINIVNEGSLSPTTLGWVDGTWDYTTMYNRIRSCNLVIQNLGPGNTDIADTVTKNRLTGQAYFLRAYFYHQLIRFYGAVPIVEKIYDLDQDYAVKRNTFEECVNFIVKDCDLAAKKLTGVTVVKGRTSSLAAMALKSRVLLYAASDLHDIPTASGKSSVISSYAQKQFLGYVSGDRTARWRAAQTAAKAVMDMGTGYKMGLSAKVTADQGKANYMSISLGGGSSDPNVDKSASNELIFARYFTPSKDEDGNFVGRNNGPNGYHNWAGNTPLGLLVDDYQMDDGTPFSWNNPSQKADPYTKRDPRLYATILFDGSEWKSRTKASGNVDPVSQIQTGKYDLMGSAGKTTVSGLDTRSSSIENWNGSRTGYYMRKFIDPNPDIVDATMKQFIPWPFFRYTEAVLNYVEASIELGELSTATQYLNQIRFRSGMPALDITAQADLRTAYRLERRIEMAYEEQRYHDARRWMIASETLGRKLTFVGVTGTFKAGKTMSAPYKKDATVYDYSYNSITDVAHENRTWVDKMYFRPFSRDEINRNSQLAQNPGY